MTEHKPWDWQKNTSDIWNVPAEDSYYLVHRWKERNFSRMLDLGCGLGRHSVQFARAGFDVYAYDLSRDAIEIVKAKAALEGLEIQAVQGDMANLPYPDGFFECVLSYHTISHTDSQGIRKIIAELRRVLRPGGEFYITLCSKKAWSFTEAGFPSLDENTVMKIEDGPENGVPHFFVDDKDIEVVLGGLNIESLKHTQDIIVNGGRYKSWHYFILGNKPAGDY